MGIHKQLNIGIIGAGYWGPNLIRNFSSLENCRVKYVCDLDASRLAKIKRAYPDIVLTTSAMDIFNDNEVSVVAIATPVATHFTLARQALERNKHVLIEKPMAASVGECDELIALARERKLVLAVDHTFIYHNPVKKIKEIINSGELGDLYYFDSQRINLGLIRPDINVIWDLAPHDVSILQFLSPGHPESVTATGTQHVTSRLCELAHIFIKYKTGLAAHIHVSWLSPVKLRQMFIGGSKKMVLFDDISPTEKVKVYDRGVSINLQAETSFNPVYRSGDIFIPQIDSNEALSEECAHFIDCVQNNTPCRTDGESGRDVVAILEAADRSMREGKTIYL